MPRTTGLSVAEITARHQRIAMRLRAGVDPKLIAHDEGVSVRTVQRARDGAKLHRNFTADEIARIESMLEDGASLAEVARTVGRHVQLISRKWRGRGWTREQVSEFNSASRRYAVL